MPSYTDLSYPNATMRLSYTRPLLPKPSILLSLLSLLASMGSLLPALANAQSNLPPSVEAVFSQTGVPQQAMSAIVIPASGGQPVLAHLSERPMNPASTMKLLTTLIALEELGPTFRWKTQILTDKPVKKDSYTGNLYLRGGGDPNLTLEKLGSMLRALRQQGFRKIRGDIILDRSYLQPERPDVGAPNFDEYPDAYYNVIPDALLVNNNLMNLGIDAGTDKINVRLGTPLDKLKVTSHLHFNDLPCSAWEKEWLPPAIDYATTPAGMTEVTLNGGFPRRCKINNSINILDRNHYIAYAIRALWQEMGGSWQGEVHDGKVPANAVVVVERTSETLADIIRIINKQSDNTMARMLFMTLGTESANKPVSNSLEAANTRIRQWLGKQNINDAGLVLENGSGLSRIERISPQQMAGILQVGARSNWNAEFSSSMPVASLDGTMRRRLKGSPAELRARIKTGTLKDVVAIAGYVRDINDQQWIVVATINHEDSIKAKSALDELISWVAAGRR
ncbi:D-alanyl-D-alanine carboxypeptidase/D-alanyl-D-alanine-endopeptidase [Undibacterium sp. CY18W]|uniref:D-alanyl-D-alanine carboxypeptidase/D-alanyl-D-alanine-endopeptidase n=2 Tax=Undibacterium hunanense TaxID=2762292 RepID=A0ABR6ZQB0_9BURK|nr:D-alanyl-D-alanine carboxypeptidase/D-alanyl-D-alanine-endopeptidase [Undibacterium hunanense]